MDQHGLHGDTPTPNHIRTPAGEAPLEGVMGKHKRRGDSPRYAEDPQHSPREAPPGPPLGSVFRAGGEEAPLNGE